MIRTIRAVLDDVREGRSFCGKPRKVYFVHVKIHQDDANASVTDINVLVNIRAGTLVRWGKGFSARTHGRATEAKKATVSTVLRRDGRLYGKN